jgi:two-component system phosphate regulon sensor histidine kinase PhoR
MVVVTTLFLILVDMWVGQIESQARGDIDGFIYLVQKSDSVEELQRIAKEVFPQSGAHILVVDLDANLLADSHIHPDSVVAGTYIDANLSATREQGKATSIVRDRRSGFLRISVGERVETSLGTLVVSFSYLMDFLPRFTRLFVAFMLLVVILITSLVYLLSSYVLRQYKRPINKLLQHTKSTSGLQGRFGRISVDSNDPVLLELAKEFNSLMDRYDLLIASNNAKYSKINTLLSHIGNGIMIVEPDNTVSLINPRAEQWLGLDKAKLFTEERTTGSESALVATILEASMRVNTFGENQWLTLQSSAGLLLDVTIERMYSKYEPYGHSGALVLIRDVTEMRRLERLKDEFVSNVSHELRTPLTVINGFVQTLGSWDSLSEADRTTSLTIIELETERLKRLISELLVLSRIEGEMDGADRIPFDLSPIVNDSILLIKPMAEEKQISIETRIEITPPLVGRELWFKQIVTNLLENAVKYSPDKTKVSLSVYAGEQDSVVLSVKDQGMGIAVEDQEKIFDRFYRVEKSRNSAIAGSGLGLAITKLMVEEFGGSIGVESKIGEGSVFTVILPTKNSSEMR